MKHANINIDSPKGMMKYYVEYFDNADIVRNDRVYTIETNGDINIFRGKTGVVRKENEWYPITVPSSATNDYMPITYDTSTLNVYFPRFAVETYESGIKYALTINTWVYGRTVYLGTYIIDRNDVHAADTVRKFANEDYYEYLSVEIPDPWNIMYGDEWEAFRREVCGVNTLVDGSFVPVEVPFVVGIWHDAVTELNDTGSIINVTLHPVRETEDGAYIEVDNYHGGQNAINLADSVSDYLSMVLTDNRNDNSYYEDRLIFNAHPVFNRAYDQNLEGFKQYIKETYQLNTYTMKMEVVVQDDTDVFRSVEKEVSSPWQEISREELAFDSWEGFHDGMFIRVFLKIYLHEGDEDAFIYLTSNRIILTQNLFCYLVGENPLNKVYLDSINMNNYTINAVNKVQQNIIQMERPDDYKANIIKPIFFRARELGGLVIHPAVTEQISINLDQYKSKVSRFMLKVEDTTFVEFGRTASGVVFKIVGANLPNKKTSGLYYILDQDGELVTTGQYIYEQ